jgi:hypothetical protein
MSRIDGDRAEIIALSFWDSREAIEGFADPDIEKSVLYPRTCTTCSSPPLSPTTKSPDNPPRLTVPSPPPSRSHPSPARQRGDPAARREDRLAAPGAGTVRLVVPLVSTLPLRAGRLGYRRAARSHDPEYGDDTVAPFNLVRHPAAPIALTARAGRCRRTSWQMADRRD